MKFTQFLKTKGAIGAIFMGIFYAIVMLSIFLPGYSAIPGNIDKLPIAIVNDDAGDYGAEIANQLQKSLPFKNIETGLSNKEAIKELEKNDVALVVHIPKTFSENLQMGDKAANIDFTINEAGATVVSSTMDSVVAEINNQISTQFSQQTAQNILMNFNVPEEQAAELSNKIETAYAGNVVKINEIPDGMHHNMLPMFLTMSVYIGAMIGALQLVGAFKNNLGKASKKRLFIYVQLTALLIAVVSSLAGTGVTFLVNEPSGNLFFSILGQQILNYMVSFNFTAIFIFLIGDSGMILNLPILLIQTIANGATVIREMMYLPYEWISYISPMYYSVQAYFAGLYGSISPSPFIWSLVLIGVISMSVNILIVKFLHVPFATEEMVARGKIESVENEAEVTV
ncbi:ABC transporter permease [Lederbergia citrisecunda]|uniref:YhgE/Pip domain-containing protein n=1 Tax=Lederbergia citrisecunda TaxID=2833583 RepID=UPI003D2ACEDB